MGALSWCEKQPIPIDSDLGLGGRLDSTPTGRGRLEFVFVASTVPCFLLSSLLTVPTDGWGEAAALVVGRPSYVAS